MKRQSKIATYRACLLILSILIVGLVALGLGSGSAKADDLPVVHVSGSLTEDETWTNDSVYLVDDDITVPDGVTLTINAGTIVKYAAGWGNGGITVASGGALDINGTSGSPVFLTSIKDDSVGGDSGGDGATSGGATDYARALNNSSGTVTMSYTTVRYAELGLERSCGNTTATDGTFNSRLSLGGCSGSTSVVLQRNQFAVTSGFPISTSQLNVSGIALSGLNQNTFSGSGQSLGMYMDSSFVPTGSSWSIAAASGVVPYVYDFAVGGNVTLGAGLVVKAHNSGSNEAFTINSGGELTLDGTSTSSVIITSIKDDSVGGDTYGDGSTSGAVNDYGMAIVGNGGSLDMEYTTIRYGTFAYYNSSASTLAMRDSTLEGTIWLSGFAHGNAIVERNQFALPSSLDSYAISASSSDVSGIALTGSDKNIFTGSAKAKTVNVTDSFIASSATWEISNTTGGVIRLQDLTVSGTFVLNAGVIVKNASSTNNDGIIVANGGELDINGGSSAPVVLTSNKDDAIGGDMEGDGTNTLTQNDYAYAISMQSGSTVDVVNAELRHGGITFSVPGGELHTDNVTIKDTELAFDIGGGEPFIVGVTVADSVKALNVGAGDVTFRGNLDNVDMGITACSWVSGDCSVDATYVDWGSNAGPFPNGGSDELACGAVVASPWITSTGTDTDNEAFGIPDCGSVPTPPESLASAMSAYYAALAAFQLDCANAIQDACDTVDNSFACLGSAINLVLAYTPVPNTISAPTSVSDTVGDDVNSGAYDYTRDVALPTPSVYSTNVKVRAIGTIGLISAIETAYNACAP